MIRENGWYRGFFNRVAHYIYNRGDLTYCGLRLKVDRGAGASRLDRCKRCLASARKNGHE